MVVSQLVLVSLMHLFPQFYQDLSAEKHLNKCFEHFILYVREFNLLDEREESPLKDMIPKFVCDRK